MLNTIVVVFKRATCIVRWVDEDTLNLAGEFLFEGFKGKKVVAEDEAVIEQVAVSHAVRRVIGLLWILEQDARLQPGPVLFPDPSKFKFWLFYHEPVCCGSLV